MNIFYINADPQIAAQQLADDHIRKMQIESAQILLLEIKKQKLET
jgi:hypothetical protein